MRVKRRTHQSSPENVFNALEKNAESTVDVRSAENIEGGDYLDGAFFSSIHGLFSGLFEVPLGEI